MFEVESAGQRPACNSATQVSLTPLGFPSWLHGGVGAGTAQDVLWTPSSAVHGSCWELETQRRALDGSLWAQKLRNNLAKILFQILNGFSLKSLTSNLLLPIII